MAIKAAAAFAICFGADGLRRQRAKDQVERSCGVGGKSLFSDGPNASIVGGQPASECTWKWQVAIKDRKDGRPWCGGMLVGANWVLTAAHCLYDEDQLWVSAGDWNWRKQSGKEQHSQSSKLHLHPKYDDWSLENDIGLIQLKTAMKTSSCVGTVCLPQKDVAPGTTCWITGWGRLSDGGSSPDVLQEVQVEVMSNKQCQASKYDEDEITDDMLCANGKNSQGKITDACSGDSGGPLVCQSSGSWTVYGATSWGEGCAKKGFPGVWSRVFYNRDWIQKTMR